MSLSLVAGLPLVSNLSDLIDRSLPYRSGQRVTLKWAGPPSELSSQGMYRWLYVSVWLVLGMPRELVEHYCCCDCEDVFEICEDISVWGLWGCLCLRSALVPNLLSRLKKVLSTLTWASTTFVSIWVWRPKKNKKVEGLSFLEIPTPFSDLRGCWFSDHCSPIVLHHWLYLTL